MKDFALIIQYEDDFGINAGLKVKVLKSGLDIGGKSEDHIEMQEFCESVNWRSAVSGTDHHM